MGKDQSLAPWPLVLASTSKYRAELLKQLGWDFTAVSPEVDEDGPKQRGLVPEDIALELSRLKAKAVYLLNEGSCVIGSDQVCRIGETILSKPGSRERAAPHTDANVWVVNAGSPFSSRAQTSQNHYLCPQTVVQHFFNIPSSLVL